MREKEKKEERKKRNRLGPILFSLQEKLENKNQKKIGDVERCHSWQLPRIEDQMPPRRCSRRRQRSRTQLNTTRCPSRVTGKFTGNPLLLPDRVGQRSPVREVIWVRKKQRGRRQKKKRDKKKRKKKKKKEKKKTKAKKEGRRNQTNAAIVDLWLPNSGNAA